MFSKWSKQVIRNRDRRSRSGVLIYQYHFFSFSCPTVILSIYENLWMRSFSLEVMSLTVLCVLHKETVEEKYGAVTFKVFYDFNNQKLQVEGRLLLMSAL